MRSNYLKKIEELKLLKQQLRARLDENKLIKENKNPERRRMDQIEGQLTKLNNLLQRVNLKYEKLSSSMINITAGINHLKEMSAFYRS